MAKKKSISLGMIIAAVAAILGLVAFIMWFVPQLTYVGDYLGNKPDPLSGLKITFGYKETIGGKEVAQLNFSFMNLLTYILVLVGIVFSVLAMLGKGGKISAIVAAAAFIIAGVFFFCAEAFVIIPKVETGLGNLDSTSNEKIAEAFHNNWGLGAGAIIGGICSILAGLGAGATLFVKK